MAGMSLAPLYEGHLWTNRGGSFLTLFFHQNGTEELCGDQKLTWAFFNF